MIPDISVHAIDMNRWQMEMHKDQVYKHAKGTMRCQANKMPTATIDQILTNIKSMIPKIDK